jgi:hypothetical protein
MRTQRVGGTPRNEYVAALGSVDIGLSEQTLIEFWAASTRRLDRIGSRLDLDTWAAIEAVIAKSIPKPYVTAEDAPLRNARPRESRNDQIEFAPDQGQYVRAIIARKVRQLEAIFANKTKELAAASDRQTSAKAKAYFDQRFPDFQKNADEAAAAAAYWRERNNNFKPIFSADEFRDILMCLHPDGERTAERLSAAFIGFRSKEVLLTGRRR